MVDFAIRGDYEGNKDGNFDYTYGVKRNDRYWLFKKE